MVISELSALEKHPDFNPAVKIDSTDSHSSEGQSLQPENQSSVHSEDSTTSQSEKQENQSSLQSEDCRTSQQNGDSEEEEEEDGLSLSLFQDDSAASSSKAGMPVL